MNVRAIGAELGVSSVLEGSVRKHNNRIRITAQLIDTAAGFHIWSKNFDRELKDIFALQDEISLLIADQIREHCGHMELQDHLVDVSHISVEVYELYLKGKHFLHNLNKTNIIKGIALLKEVTERAPDFALAYAYIHYGYNMLAAAGLAPSEKTLEKGEYYLNRALELNPSLPECYHSLGWHSLNRSWDFISAKKFLMKALDLRPAYADAHQKLFITLALEGNIEAADNHICTALKLDPLSALNHYFRGFSFYLQEKYLQAITSYRKCFELEPPVFLWLSYDGVISDSRRKI
jgi:adenylate cyclase